MKRFDPFLASLIGAICVASLFPCPTSLQPWLQRLTSLLIILMFFFQGLKLQKHVVIESLQNWPLQGATLATSFLFFPLVGLVLYHIPFIHHLLAPNLWTGVLFLCCLPSTIQSSIALTSIARGNVSASICAATLSNIIGIFISPILISLLLHKSGHNVHFINVLAHVSIELLLPFITGQLSQKWLGSLITHHKILLSLSDRGSIIILVYAAFSSAVVHGLWHLISLSQILMVAFFNSFILTLSLVFTACLGRFMKQTSGNIISLQFCGSKKALSVGISMANVLFPANAGIIVLPLMLFHQIQLFICTILAKYYAKHEAIHPGARKSFGGFAGGLKK